MKKKPLTPAQKRLKKYLEDPKKYHVDPVRYGCLNYFDVFEYGVGIIDRITTRTFDRAIELGIVTYKQLADSNKL